MANLKKETILLLEDELALAEVVKESLGGQGFDVIAAKNIQEATDLLKLKIPDILVLDVMLPDGDGFSFLKKIRVNNKSVPAIFLTAKSMTNDVVKGFESGCNDYLKKPFSMEELIIRIKSLLGNLKSQSETLEKTKTLFEIGDINFHYPEGILTYQGSKKQLTFREAEILYDLTINKAQMIPRNDLLIKYWGYNDYFSGRSLDVFITKLRKYLNADPSIAILNYRGHGYKLIY